MKTKKFQRLRKLNSKSCSGKIQFEVSAASAAETFFCRDLSGAVNCESLSCGSIRRLHGRFKQLAQFMGQIGGRTVIVKRQRLLFRHSDAPLVIHLKN